MILARLADLGVKVTPTPDKGEDKSEQVP